MFSDGSRKGSVFILSSVLDVVNFFFLLSYIEKHTFPFRKATINLLHLLSILFRVILPPGQNPKRNCIQRLVVVLLDQCLKGTRCHWQNSENGRCFHVPFHFMLSPVTSDGSRWEK